MVIQEIMIFFKKNQKSADSKYHQQKMKLSKASHVREG